MNSPSIQDYSEFLQLLKSRVSNARIQASRAVNKELILLYHQIGTDILKQQGLEGWGAKVIERISKDLSSAFPEMKGFSPRNLKYMRLFADIYQELIIVQQVVAQLPWSHIVRLLDKVKDPAEQLFYMKKTLEHGWSRSVLIHQIELGLYKRQGKAITNFKDQLPSPHSDLAQQTFKDPYIFDFLSLSEEAHERELENALMSHMQKFLLELGAGFSFVGRQYYLEVGGDDFYIDLLFYHFKLRCFVAIELKTDKFKPEYAGKMNFYLSALDSILKHPDDKPSIGLILCKTKNEVLAEYALRDMTKAIGLAEYRLTEALPDNIKTALPSIEELEAELSKDLDGSNESDQK